MVEKKNSKMELLLNNQFRNQSKLHMEEFGKQPIISLQNSEEITKTIKQTKFTFRTDYQHVQ